MSDELGLWGSELHNALDKNAFKGRLDEERMKKLLKKFDEVGITDEQDLKKPGNFKEKYVVDILKTVEIKRLKRFISRPTQGNPIGLRNRSVPRAITQNVSPRSLPSSVSSESDLDSGIESCDDEKVETSGTQNVDGNGIDLCHQSVEFEARIGENPDEPRKKKLRFDSTKNVQAFERVCCRVDYKDITNIPQKQLSVFKLRQCTFEFEPCKMWKGLWKKQCRIESLMLQFTDIHNKLVGFMKCVVECEVENLSMEGCRLRQDDIQDLADQMKKLTPTQKPRLQKLNLQYNRIDPDGLEAVAKLLSCIRDMEEVNICGCHLTDEALKKFEAIISMKTMQIKTLNIGLNDEMTPNGLECVGRIAKKCNVRSLNIMGCCLTAKHITSLAKNETQVIHLTLDENVNIFPKDLLHLAKKWTTLEELDLKNCELRQKARDELAHELPKIKINY